MNEIDDLVKPYIEYLAGRSVPKVSPKRRHGWSTRPSLPFSGKPRGARETLLPSGAAICVPNHIGIRSFPTLRSFQTNGFRA